jgi:hypothetical protein
MRGAPAQVVVGEVIFVQQRLDIGVAAAPVRQVGRERCSRLPVDVDQR